MVDEYFAELDWSLANVLDGWFGYCLDDEGKGHVYTYRH